MTNKEKTLIAWKELLNKYKKNDPKEVFFTVKHCPLCKIFFNGENDCYGCPLADEDGAAGCIACWSFKIASAAYRKNRYDRPECFKIRAKFFRDTYKIIEQIPEERFTVDGWEYFYELDRSL